MLSSAEVTGLGVWAAESRSSLGGPREGTAGGKAVSPLIPATGRPCAVLRGTPSETVEEYGGLDDRLPRLRAQSARGSAPWGAGALASPEVEGVPVVTGRGLGFWVSSVARTAPAGPLPESLR